MFRIFVRILIVLHCLSLIQARSQRFQLEIYNYTCESLTEHLKRFDCYFRKVAQSHFVINQYLIFSQSMGEEFEGRVIVRIQPQAVGKPFNFLDMRLKVCDFITNPIQSRLLMTAQNEMKKASNVPLTCPLRKNFLYKFVNLSVSNAYVPSYAPFLNFSYSFDYYSRNILFAVSKIMGAIVPYKK